MQPRDAQAIEFWDRSKELTSSSNYYRIFVERFLSFLLKSDIKNGDFTTHSLIANKKNISGIVVAKENGIFAGLEELKMFSNGLAIKSIKNDGSMINDGDIILEIEGDARKILERERTYLNLLQRMSGIATLTHSLNEEIKNKVKIAATRKTFWGLLDKKAVSIGGGLTHRLNLSDGILIKDNHLKILNHDFEKAITLVQNISKYVEIEVENKNQAIAAAKAVRKLKNKNFFAIMLDKIHPENIKSIIKALKKEEIYNSVLIEASGNINQKNVKEYSDAGADIISMGCLTNSSKALNLSLEIK